MTTISVQKFNVPLATIKDAVGVPVPVYISMEWYRALELMAKRINLQQEQIAALDARLTAHGG
jgi:hypothetical protein